ncbi:BREX-4 system phosphatase PglZ [Methanolobus sediminis]|uniref:BREX-4 system phosphatase PglZ n=1 Tax=Methanolobus sediminis TaxID=3072978 RepID=A0AA51UMG9_9EURY|nr:BREX-4 system phosphatase PglZ [Methanolobus sediminis]WMW25967.1 BREX-4 system phosphatase PglZ [Methanolobus sediminis]
MLIQAVKNYLSSPVTTPYFLVVGDEKYKDIKGKLLELGFDFVKLSDHCSDDRLPDIDGLLERLKTADVNGSNKRLVVIGLGEYLALSGSIVTTNILLQLKDLNIGSTKVILLLRGVATQIKDLQRDPRFDSRRLCIHEKVDCDLSFTLADPSVDLPTSLGIKTLLLELESGLSGNVVVSTTLNFDNALFNVHKITDAYEGIKFSMPGFSLLRSCGSDEQWAELLMELMRNEGSLDAVLEKNGFDSMLESNFYVKVAGLEYRNWLYFIALKSKSDTLSNSYLRFVLDTTDRFEDFKMNVLNAIINVSHNDKQFCTFYAERKTLVEKFPEPDVADFVVNNRKDPSESIFKLTDGTKTEREEVIAWVSQHGIIPQISYIYPALAAYLREYVFNCGDLSNLLTEYFEAYKRQKVLNMLEDDFIDKVESFAKSRNYNRLPTRNEIIEGLSKDDTYLYWLDALGVEYMAFILELVRQRGLSISINIARAELPTITSINHDFYDAWRGRKRKNDKLDDTKHSDDGGYNFENNILPIHLAKELSIIEEVIYEAATELGMRKCKRFLIASDHGASRLAVLRRKEERYETDTKGEHSGRCCKSFEPYDLPFAAEENGYLVLADYGRFKGSRAANVEVHGGASLEEVVVPIIELTLKDKDITVEMVEEFVTVDFRTGAEVTLFFNSPLKNVSVILNGKRYSASPLDSNHHNVVLPDIKRAGDYRADVYAGDDLIGEIHIKAQGKSGKVNDAFDDLF